MAQMSPNYPFMTSAVNEIFTTPLIAKYGYENVVWPIVIIQNNTIDFYIYEVNGLCTINHLNDNRPASISSKTNYFVDYTTEPRIIIPPFEELKEFIEKDFNCSYDFILKSNKYSSVDIDYAWFNGSNWKGIELTTLYMPLKNKEEAERLVKMFTRRPSWQGPNGPHGIRKLIDASQDLKIDYYFVLVNSVKGVSNNLVVDGNAYWFPLTHNNIDRILNKFAPLNASFGSFKDMLEWL